MTTAPAAVDVPIPTWTSYIAEYDLAPRLPSIDSVANARDAFGLVSDQLERLRNASNTGFGKMDQLVVDLNRYADKMNAGLQGLENKLSNDIKTGLLKSELWMSCTSLFFFLYLGLNFKSFRQVSNKNFTVLTSV